MLMAGTNLIPVYQTQWDVLLQNYYLSSAPPISLPHFQHTHAQIKTDIVCFCVMTSHNLVVGTGVEEHTSAADGLLKIHIVCTFEALITIYQTAWYPKLHHNIKYSTLWKHDVKNVKNISDQEWMFHDGKMN